MKCLEIKKPLFQAAKVSQLGFVTSLDFQLVKHLFPVAAPTIEATFFRMVGLA